MRIRLVGTPAELDTGVDIVRTNFHVTHTSDLRPARGSEDQYRVYFDVEPPAPRSAAPTAPTPRAVAERLRKAAARA